MKAALAMALLLPFAASASDRNAIERRWIDAEGVEHISVKMGPSVEARRKAETIDVDVRATRTRAKVHELSDYDLHIADAADKYKIPQELVRAIIAAESNFDPTATSRVGAQGLMQLMPGTAGEMYVQNAYDPAQNIHGGTRYLRILANMFDGDLVRTVAAYNAGPDAVRKAGGTPRYAETQGYVKKVIKLYRVYKGLDS